MLLPIVVIRNRALEGEVISILTEMAQEFGVEIIKIVYMNEKSIVAYGDRACLPNDKLEDIIVSNPAIYLAYNPIEGGMQIEEKEDLLNLKNELTTRLKILDTYSKLPRLDCGRCGFKDCFEFARSVVSSGRALSGCPILSSESRVLISVNGKRIFILPWVEKLFRSLIFAFLSNLKGVNIKGDERIILEVKK